MRAAVIEQTENVKKIKMKNVDRPQISNNEVLVKVESVGICGSDLQGFFDQDSTKRVPGLIMGHEASGEVVEIGSDVTRVKLGDRVAIDPQVTCGYCESCKRGWYSVCDNKKIIGSNLKGFLHGAMAEFAAIDQNQLFILPNNVSYKEGALVEPLSNAIHIFNRVKLNIGDKVVVIGAGTLGLCILQVAKLAGAEEVIVIDKSDHRLGVAEKLRADITINPSDTDVENHINKITKNRGVDVVVEAVGIDATYRQAISLVRKKGTIMFFGAAQDLVTLDLYPILHKEIKMIGCTGADWEA